MLRHPVLLAVVVVALGLLAAGLYRLIEAIGRGCWPRVCG